ncbi:nitroreductase family deazaflavin-dependent oxidoreductase [Nocardioides humilatus]|uniref:Nitroreductase family deazaflavin-dependent oxidoreductase n=1 Tax=Nocardioides humilatus TaxID=2607660 RepID=A0A5B1LBP0_9ACTN|nr:nitroreductase/quinone reductase family protein [Nocardioides humilatus]KAA1417684.1 nitroreductase family deazaflavin-dependent oxidoreductase [Nocardioides humilatus]
MTIPDYSWGRRGTLVANVAQKFASTKAGSWTIRKLMPLDRKLLVRTRGRKTILGPVGAPTLVLETIGRKSGLPRLSPLLYTRDGDAVIVVGSNFGQEHHPAWTGNLIAHPEVRVISGGVEVPVVAELLTGDEAAAGWQMMVDNISVYAAYKSRTDRDIRVFRLTPSA